MAKRQSATLDYTNVVIPKHIAIIMDGNGRWAKKRLLPRKIGHRQGAETFRKISRICGDIGVSYLTVYAFSTENWNRPKDEVDALLALLSEYLDEAKREIVRENRVLRVLGDLSVFPQELLDKIAEIDRLSAQCTGITVNLCINYGGRHELVQTIQSLCVSGTPISELNITKALYTGGMPDPDLLIRPGGEQRISNFLLWQIAYAELYFTDVLWPDFDERQLYAALAAYTARNRRFGAVAQ